MVIEERGQSSIGRSEASANYEIGRNTSELTIFGLRRMAGLFPQNPESSASDAFSGE
jgi:hypothetical protein